LIRKGSISFLELALHGHRVGFVAGYKSGRNVLIFAPEFRENSRRPTFSLTTHPEFPRAEKLLSTQWIKRQRLHPVLSNLLPEGALREMLSLGLKVLLMMSFNFWGISVRICRVRSLLPPWQLVMFLPTFYRVKLCRSRSL
jgi:serine/threonine-protein kinase HipA